MHSAPGHYRAADGYDVNARILGQLEDLTPLHTTIGKGIGLNVFDPVGKVLAILRGSIIRIDITGPALLEFASMPLDEFFVCDPGIHGSLLLEGKVHIEVWMVGLNPVGTGRCGRSLCHSAGGYGIAIS